jgi:outer membrane murein-binding lipoprotein Lpp
MSDEKDIKISQLAKEVKKLKSVVADLETAMDDIPPFIKVWAAVRELQELHDAPAATLVHYLGGFK